MSEKEKIILHIDGYKFDVTEYAAKHPGGKRILKKI
jgi:cytochrome b involved in lipid metabolism